MKLLSLGGVILPLICICHFDLYLYGDSSDFHSIITYCECNDVSVKGIIVTEATDEAIQDISCRYNQPPVLNNFSEISDPGRAYILVVKNDLFTGCDRSWEQLQKLKNRKRQKERKRIMEEAKRAGIKKVYFCDKKEIREINNVIDSRHYNERAKLYRMNMNALCVTFDLLGDDESKATMYEYIRVYMQSGTYSREMCDGKRKYFTGGQYDKNPESLYRHLDDEVWMNCGASVGDNIFSYFSQGYKARKIYAFEGDEQTYEMLCQNIRFLPECLSRVVKPVNKFISDGTSWNSDIDEKVTFVNADIEGNELNLLQSINNRIVSDRPVLAICVYHKPLDLVELPQYVNELVSDYVYLLRKYPSTNMNPMRTSELVLYCIPKERAVINEK